jgi:endoglycosylceramidase
MAPLTSAGFFAAIAAFLMCSTTCTQAAQAPTTLSAISGSASSPFLYDAEGRVRIFHGLNAVQKGFPWYPDYLLNDDALLADMAAWGTLYGIVYSGLLTNTQV